MRKSKKGMAYKRGDGFFVITVWTDIPKENKSV